MKKMAGLTVLVLSVLVGASLLCMAAGTVRYSECVVSKEQFERIREERTEACDLLEELVFEEEALFFDPSDRTFYYSLNEESREGRNPGVRAKGGGGPVKIVFLEEDRPEGQAGEKDGAAAGITEDEIRNNRSISVLAYTGDRYAEYVLRCTTLPLMNIETDAEVQSGEQIGEEAVSMRVTLYDNRAGAAQRVTVSDGSIHVRGNTTKLLPKKGYRFSLTQESVGDHTRSNAVSLLGMRQDDDWLLYPAYNDQEKIRNVFSANLWKYSCGTDNAEKLDTGMEYKYLELFFDGEYWGLYALGYPIDEKLLQMNPASGEEVLYKGVSWFADGTISFTGTGVSGFRIKGLENEQAQNWGPLLEYYCDLDRYREEDEKLLAGIDLDNAIDIYLFVNLIQGVDHAMGGKNIKNLYLALRKGEYGPTALYCPWDMDLTWGSSFVNDLSVNLSAPYELTPSNHVLMHSGYLNQLLVNGSDPVWKALFEKYRTLRRTGWSEERIDALLKEYEADIYGSGAYLREMARWPEGSYRDPGEGLDTFRVYVAERLGAMDAYYEELELSREDGRNTYELQVQADSCISLPLYLEMLAAAGKPAVIRIGNPDVWQDVSLRRLFRKLGVPERAMEPGTVLIAAGGFRDADGSDGERETAALDEEQAAQGAASPVGSLRLAVNDAGGYEVYRNGGVCFSGLWDNPDEDIRIVLLDVRTGAAADDVLFSCELTEGSFTVMGAGRIPHEGG